MQVKNDEIKYLTISYLVLIGNSRVEYTIYLEYGINVFKFYNKQSLLITHLSKQSFEYFLNYFKILFAVLLVNLVRNVILS